MTDTADLTNAEVGDVLHLADGGALEVTHVSGGLVWHNLHSWHQNGMHCVITSPSPFNCIRIEKKPKPVSKQYWVEMYISDADGETYVMASSDMPTSQKGFKTLAISGPHTITEGDGL